jgi:hypothetical protein
MLTPAGPIITSSGVWPRVPGCAESGIEGMFGMFMRVESPAAAGMGCMSIAPIFPREVSP